MNRIALAAALAGMIAATTPAFATVVCWDDPVVLGQCANPAPELTPGPYKNDPIHGVSYTTTEDLGGGHSMTYVYYKHGQAMGYIDGELVSIWITKNGRLVKTYQR